MSNGWSPCPYCKKLFNGEEQRDKHIKHKNGHGTEICPNCKEPLSKCKDIDGIGQAFCCKRKKYKNKFLGVA